MKRTLRRQLDAAHHRARMYSQVWRFIINRTPDITELDDNPVFSERQPPYDWEREG